MKQTLSILFIILFLSCNSFAQKKDSVIKKADSLTADTKLLSVNDLYRLSEPLKEKYSAKSFENYLAIINEIMQAAVKEYYDKLNAHKK